MAGLTRCTVDETKSYAAGDLAKGHAEQARLETRMFAPEVVQFGPPLRRGFAAWGVFTGCNGEDPQLVAVFADRDDAEAYARQPDETDPACLLFTDPRVDAVHAVVLFDNHVSADWCDR